jgi:hypothetical protein
MKDKNETNKYNHLLKKLVKLPPLIFYISSLDKRSCVLISFVVNVGRKQPTAFVYDHPSPWAMRREGLRWAEMNFDDKPPTTALTLFIRLIIHLFQLIFLARTIFFSHNKSDNSVFQPELNGSIVSITVVW